MLPVVTRQSVSTPHSVREKEALRRTMTETEVGTFQMCAFIEKFLFEPDWKEHN